MPSRGSRVKTQGWKDGRENKHECSYESLLWKELYFKTNKQFEWVSPTGFSCYLVCEDQGVKV